MWEDINEGEAGRSLVRSGVVRFDATILPLVG